MPRIKPVSHEAKLTLVEHLDELRTRLMVALTVFVVAFIAVYAQKEWVMDAVNKPLIQASSTPRDCTKAGDTLEKESCFNQKVADALTSVAPLLNKLSTSADTDQDQQQVADALKSIDQVNEFLPKDHARNPVTLGVAEPFFATITVTFYISLIVVLPLLLYQVFAFLLPAFTPREKKSVIPAMVMVPLLFYAGAAFGYFLILPRAVDFLQNFNDGSFDILLQAKDYYRFSAMLVAGVGLAFQVPVFVLALSRMGIVSAAKMREQWGIVLIISLAISAVVTPTQDPVTMLLVAAPIVVLFVVAVAVAAILEKRYPSSGLWGDDEYDYNDSMTVGDGRSHVEATAVHTEAQVTSEYGEAGSLIRSQRMPVNSVDPNLPLYDQLRGAFDQLPETPQVSSEQTTSDKSAWQQLADDLDSQDPYAD